MISDFFIARSIGAKISMPLLLSQKFFQIIILLILNIISTKKLIWFLIKSEATTSVKILYFYVLSDSVQPLNKVYIEQNNCQIPIEMMKIMLVVEYI